MSNITMAAFDLPNVVSKEEVADQVSDFLLFVGIPVGTTAYTYIHGCFAKHGLKGVIMLVRDISAIGSVITEHWWIELIVAAILLLCGAIYRSKENWKMYWDNLKTNVKKVVISDRLTKAKKIGQFVQECAWFIARCALELVQNIVMIILDGIVASVKLGYNAGTFAVNALFGSNHPRWE